MPYMAFRRKMTALLRGCWNRIPKAYCTAGSVVCVQLELSSSRVGLDGGEFKNELAVQIEQELAAERLPISVSGIGGEVGEAGEGVSFKVDAGVEQNIARRRDRGRGAGDDRRRAKRLM